MIYLYKNEHIYATVSRNQDTIRIPNFRSTASTTFDDTIAE